MELLTRSQYFTMTTSSDREIRWAREPKTAPRPCLRGFPPQKQKSEDHSGSIRDITARLIHDKNTSITESCTVFSVPSAGNDPGWIYWSYEFLFFRPQGLWTRRPAQTGPGAQNLRFPRFDPMILCSFLATIRIQH